MTSAGETEAPKPGADVVGRHRRLVRRTALISILTLVSRILGFVREVLSAALFGDKSAIYDAFITAWRIPNLFRRFLGEGALSTSFQTALTEVDGDQGEAAGARLFRDTFRTLTWTLLVLTAVVMVLVAHLPDTMPLTDWRWLGADPEPVRDLTERLTPFLILVCLSALIGGALQVRGHFAAPAWAPAAMNVVWILALVVVGQRFGWIPSAEDAPDPGRHLGMAHLLAWGVLAAGAVQLLVQVPALRRTGFLGATGGTPRLAPRLGPAAILRRAAPLALGAAVYQINVMIDGLMAEGLLPNGGPTLHYYANRVQQFPLALVAVAATSAVFPALQAHGHRRDRASVRRLHDRTHRAIVFVALPASVGLFVLALPVITVSFEHGAFGPEGVARATAGLRMLALAILPAGATGLLARTYYALGDFRTPVRVSIAMLVANVGLNLALIRGAGMDVDGLALATAITSWGNVLLLVPGLTRKLGLPPGAGGNAPPTVKMGVASAVSGFAAAATWSLSRTHAGEITTLALAIAAGVASYLVTATLLGVPEARELGRRLRRGRGSGTR